MVSHRNYTFNILTLDMYYKSELKQMGGVSGTERCLLEVANSDVITYYINSMQTDYSISFSTGHTATLLFPINTQALLWPSISIAIIIEAFHIIHY